MYRKLLLNILILLLLSLTVAGCSHSADSSLSPDKAIENQEIINETGLEQLSSDLSSSNKLESKTANNNEEAGSAADKFEGATSTAKMDENNKDEGLVRLVVTLNYGEQVLGDDKYKLLSQCSVLDFCSSYLEIETAYGGGFINSINGIRSGYTEKMGFNKKKQDWFLYINGVLAATGANDYEINKGDVIWWDYHEWGSNIFVPAMIGAYPSPFQENADIFYSSSCSEYAADLENIIQGDALINTSINIIDKNIIEYSKPALVIGLWSELQENSQIKDLMDNYFKIGMFCFCDNEGMHALKSNMADTEQIFTTGSGCIVATGNTIGDPNPLWFIIGYDETGLQLAIKQLEKGIPANCAWGLIVDPEGIYPLPARDEGDF